MRERRACSTGGARDEDASSAEAAESRLGVEEDEEEEDADEEDDIADELSSPRADHQKKLSVSVQRAERLRSAPGACGHAKKGEATLSFLHSFTREPPLCFFFISEAAVAI